ncbi:MAG: hypothetical protein JWQ64_3546 [Subtercola sp.]|jgi:hypothetical protein|nr:hypothetical protein [Subtercola sp.]
MTLQAPSVDDRLAALEARLGAAEDRLAIYQIIATYGPTVDTVSPDGVTSIWLDDGVYDSGGYTPMEGAQAIRDMLFAPTHQALVERGCAHIMSMPHVTLSGDTAVAVGYSCLFARTGDRWITERVSANRWELTRAPAGWRVTSRTNRQLAATDESRALLRLP